MDAALATVTVISLSMAFTMGVVAWRLLREERRRADARVTVLMADLERARDPHVSPVALAAPHGSTPPPRVRTATSAPPRGQTASARPKTRPVPSTGEVVVSRARVAQSTAGLFAQITGSSRSLHPLVVTVATAVVILAAISATMLFGLPALSGDTPTGLGVGATGPVELLSLAHTRTGDYLAISGSLRNPPRWGRAWPTERHRRRVRPRRRGGGNRTDAAARGGAAPGERNLLHHLATRRRPDQPISRRLRARTDQRAPPRPT